MPNDVSESRRASLPRPTPAAQEVIAAFSAALRTRDILAPAELLADGILHRCDAAGKNGRGDAAYLLHLDGIPAGGFDNWRDGLGWQTWRFNGNAPLSSQERDALRARADAARQQREIEVRRRHGDAAILARRVWDSAQVAPADHPYLVLKGVGSYGLRVYKGALIVPLFDAAGMLSSLQFIGATGGKRFLKGGSTVGGYFVIGEIADTLCIAEGYATAASIHVATGYAVVVAFSAGNLVAVAATMRELYSGARLILCADDDSATAGNPGLSQAREAARVSRALLATPTCTGERLPVTDFNDLHRLRGLDAVREAIERASQEALDTCPTQTAESSNREWPEPEPLTQPFEAHPYPLEALPLLMREAVREVQAFVQAPAALVGASALAALSLAAQGSANVRRDHQLVGPVSVYLLSVADSGERKTTCDVMFGTSLREWEIERRQELAPELNRNEAALAIFEAKKAGILDAIKLKRRRGEDASARERELQELIHDAPEPMRVPRLLYADATPEALAFSLASGWPSGGVLSAEAGAVFGAHSMGQDSILRNLALLNVLWDGGEMAIDRRSKPSFRLRGRRLTFGLMVQPDALRGFLDRAGSLPRGTGFLARFLVAWPASTQGSRRYRQAPSSLPGVESFGRRIRELLQEPLITDEHGCLTPTVLELSPAARSEWINLHDCVEDELGTRGEFRDIRDVAAKAAENVARLAALFHVLEHGPAGTIGTAPVDAAGSIVLWHLSEARRLLRDLDTPPILAAAIKLDRWLCNEAATTESGRASTRRIFQYGPSCVRDSQAFKAAMALLTERGRARMEFDGRRRYVAVNPMLLNDSA